MSCRRTRSAVRRGPTRVEQVVGVSSLRRRARLRLLSGLPCQMPREGAQGRGILGSAGSSPIEKSESNSARFGSVRAMPIACPSSWVIVRYRSPRTVLPVNVASNRALREVNSALSCGTESKYQLAGLTAVLPASLSSRIVDRYGLPNGVDPVVGPTLDQIAERLSPTNCCRLTSIVHEGDSKHIDRVSVRNRSVAGRPHVRVVEVGDHRFPVVDRLIDDAPGDRRVGAVGNSKLSQRRGWPRRSPPARHATPATRPADGPPSAGSAEGRRWSICETHHVAFLSFLTIVTSTFRWWVK